MNHNSHTSIPNYLANPAGGAPSSRHGREGCKLCGELLKLLKEPVLVVPQPQGVSSWSANSVGKVTISMGVFTTQYWLMFP